MSIYLCPKGHQSTEPDYCSECGTRIQGSSEQLLTTTELPAVVPFSESKFTEKLCPDCSAPHELDSGDFCEICGYNFVTGAHGEMPISANSSVIPDSSKSEEGEPPSPALEIISIPPSPSSLSWEITVMIDAVPHDPESPPPPDDFTPFSIHIERSTNLIGRTSQARAIYPEISLDFDDAISHRHALLNRNQDGNLILRDIGSANGTQLNNVELKPMIDAPLRNGDEITLGHWTRIKVTGY